MNLKEKLVIYTKAFVEIYNWRNYELVYETRKIVKLEKNLISKIKNPLNLDIYQFNKISLIMQNIYIVLKDK